MSRNIVEIHKELSKLRRELERIPSSEVRMVTGTLAFGGGPRYAPVSEVRDELNTLWRYLNQATNLASDMRVAPE